MAKVKKIKVDHHIFSIVVAALMGGFTRSLRAFAAAKRKGSPGGAEVTEKELHDLFVEGFTGAAEKVKDSTGIDLVPIFASFGESAETVAELKAEIEAFKAKLAGAPAAELPTVELPPAVVEAIAPILTPKKKTRSRAKKKA